MYSKTVLATAALATAVAAFDMPVCWSDCFQQYNLDSEGCLCSDSLGAVIDKCIQSGCASSDSAAYESWLASYCHEAPVTTNTWTAPATTYSTIASTPSEPATYSAPATYSWSAPASSSAVPSAPASYPPASPSEPASPPAYTPPTTLTTSATVPAYPTGGYTYSVCTEYTTYSSEYSVITSSYLTTYTIPVTEATPTGGAWTSPAGYTPPAGGYTTAPVPPVYGSPSGAPVNSGSAAAPPYPTGTAWAPVPATGAASSIQVGGLFAAVGAIAAFFL